MIGELIDGMSWVGNSHFSPEWYQRSSIINSWPRRGCERKVSIETHLESEESFIPLSERTFHNNRSKYKGFLSWPQRIHASPIQTDVNCSQKPEDTVLEGESNTCITECKHQEKSKSWEPKEGEIAEGAVTRLIISRNPADLSADVAYQHTRFANERKCEGSTKKKEVINISATVNDIKENDFSYTLNCGQNPGLGEKTDGAETGPAIQYYFWKAEQFQHFDYVYKLSKDCECRVEKLLHKNGIDLQSRIPGNDNIKLGIVGDFTTDNVKKISKRFGKRNVSNNKHTWIVTPLVCFQNDVSSNSIFKKNVLHQKSACHKILIKSDACCDKTDEDGDGVISVGQDRDQIQKIITSCLEEPLYGMLKKWSEILKSESLKGSASDIIAEIEAIRKKLIRINSKDIAVPSNDTETIVPSNVKDYLFGRSDVNSFGIWSNSSFKVFVKKTTDENELRCELIMLNKTFFQTYQLHIESKKWKEIENLKQGDSIQSKDYAAGTLGGFVTKTNDDQKIFALTCNHLFPKENEPAYTRDLEEIGTCLFTTRYKGCDFAAIEIKESCLGICDVTFRRDDQKKINAKVHSKGLETESIVHKIGATTDVTNGIILSSEFYLKVIDKGNRENIFLVKGTAGKFSKKGDSGALVFSRPNCIKQNYVDVVGMVYANDLELYDDAADDDADDNDDAKDQNKMKPKCCKGSLEEGAKYDEEIKPENKQSCSEFDNPDGDNNTATGNKQDTEGVSFCCRIHTTLELFKENQGSNYEFKFKNDVSSSESDDSNEENN